jgi:hypothetical protein
MAYVLFDLNYHTQLIAKNMDELNLRNSRWKVWQDKKVGHMVEISDTDFVLLQKGLKDINYDGKAVSLKDPVYIHYPQNAEDLQEIIDYLIKLIDSNLNKYKDTSFSTELTNFKNNLQSIDTSSITYPMTTNVMQYLSNQNKSILGYLQLV